MPQYPQIEFVLDYKKDIKNALRFFSWHKNDTFYLKNFFPEDLTLCIGKKF